MSERHDTAVVATVAGVAVDTRHWIDGRRVTSPATFPDASPIDGAPLAEIARGGAAEAAAAVTAARAAFPGWAATGREERARILHAIADGVEKRIEELAAVETADNGALLRSHRRGVMPRVAHNFRFFADWLLTLGHEDFETRGHTNHVSWDPAGVCALITPWNAPLMLATWKVAPALAAGNTVVLKPAEVGPAHRLPARRHRRRGRAARRRAQRPPGLRRGGRRRPRPRTRDVARISFTGSVPTARRIAARRGRQPDPRQPRARRQVPAAGLRRRRPGPRRRAGRRAVRQRRPGLPRRHPAAGRGLHRRGVHPAPRREGRRAAAGRPARRGHRHRPQHPPRPRSHASTVSSSARWPPAPAPSSAAAPTPSWAGSTTARPSSRTSPPDARDRHGGGLRPGADPADLRHRGRGRRAGQRHPFRPGRHARDRRPGARRAGHHAAGRRHRLGQLLLRTRPAGARSAAHGQSGIGREGGTWSFDFYCDVKNTVTAPKGHGSTMGEIVGAGICSPMCPRSCCPRPTRLELNEGKDTTLVAGLQRLRREVFETPDYDTVVRARLALGHHRGVRRHRPRPPRRAVHVRGAAARDVPDPVRLPRRPRTRPRDSRARRASTAPGSPPIDDPLPADLLRHGQPVEVPRRGLGKRWISMASCQTGDTEDFLRARPGARATASPPPTARCCSSPPAPCRTPSGRCARSATTRPATPRTSSRPRRARPTRSASPGSRQGATTGSSTHARVPGPTGPRRGSPLPDDGRRARRGRGDRAGPPVQRVRELGRHRPGAHLVRPAGRRLDRARGDEPEPACATTRVTT